MNKIDLRKVDLNLLLLFETLMREGSVSKAAEQLGRTQSAISHALARLREQLGDPLLVKVGGRMQPSPYALELVQEIRPILRSIERVLSPREAFDAATSTRRFRLVVPDLAMSLFSHLMQRIQREAPNIMIEWDIPKLSTPVDVAEEIVDLALLPEAIQRPEGVASRLVGDFQWACFMRSGHPALQRWGKKSWAEWPHIVVGIGDRVRNPVISAAEKVKLQRRTGLIVPTFGAVAPLLAQTDMLTTLPVIVLADVMRRFELQVKPVPFAIPDMPHVLAWSARLNNDPASRWLRECFAEIYQVKLAEAGRLI
ncbi:LysR family transcriptional regulator [Serratia oryzae]|uniref:LysR family transcriptional regulator n=1 Tax=Serratia oryzae TaxID=2034155 RepID=A0A1S8CKT8_9GAMM|nr:LysR family transcriptional regulator [Serratia oryzae]OMQ23835.1 LysR family transcriptional regulator [Serratia oryzae]VXD08888.1 LysR family transcriptional regulator [Enterobacterales bacterium 8AC]